MYGKRCYVGRKRWTKPSRLSIGVEKHNQKIEELRTVDFRDNPVYTETRDRYNLQVLIRDIREEYNERLRTY